MTRRRRDLPKGIERTPFGFRAWQWVPVPGRRGGRMCSKRFPKDATFAKMEEWREDRRVEARKPAAKDQPLTGFAADVVTYLEAVKALPSYTDRVRDMRAWLEIFGDATRQTITSAQIRAARDRWLTKGPKYVAQVDPKTKKRVWIPKEAPLAAATVNHRLRALENLWTVLDGRGAPNPVREVPEVLEPDPEPRDVPYSIVRAILAKLPDWTRPTKGQAREVGSLTKVRLEVMAWQGLRPAQLARLKPQHLLWPLRVIQIQRSRKGPRQDAAPAKPKLVRMTTEGYKALRRFDALNAYGPFSHSSMYKTFQCAVRAVNADRKDKKLPPLGRIRPYDLRHTFLTHMTAATDLATAQAFATHSKPELTARYAAAAIASQQAAATKAFDAHVRGENSPPTTPQRRKQKKTA